MYHILLLILLQMLLTHSIFLTDSLFHFHAHGGKRSDPLRSLLWCKYMCSEESFPRTILALIHAVAFLLAQEPSREALMPYCCEARLCWQVTTTYWLNLPEFPLVWYMYNASLHIQHPLTRPLQSPIHSKSGTAKRKKIFSPQLSK